MTSFDDTYTDREFEQEIKRADSDWMAGLARNEPDLSVEGLKGSFLSRLLGLFGPRAR